MSEDESRLDTLFEAYRDACPEVQPGSHFMPDLWQNIEARRSFWFVFQREARTFITASAALCLLLLVLNFVGAANTHAPALTYTDALMAEHTAETTYYTEAMRSTPGSPEDSIQR